MAEIELIGVPFDGYGRPGTRRGRRVRCATPGCSTPSTITTWSAMTTSDLPDRIRHAARRPA